MPGCSNIHALQRETLWCALGAINPSESSSAPGPTKSVQRRQDLLFRCKCSWEYRLVGVFRLGFFWGRCTTVHTAVYKIKKTKNRRNGVLVIYVNFLTFPEWILRLFLQYSLIFFVSLCWCCFVLWQLIELVAEIMSHKCPQANQQNTDSYVSLRIQAQGSLKIPHVLRANVAFGKGVNDYLLL